MGKGFTLVEIAIVLVVVGLLMGGVLKGQEMIVNAKLKRIESDHSGISAAMFSYQDRYRQLPGDDSEVQSRFDLYTTLNPVDVNGNGQGTIEGSWDANNITSLSTAGGVETEKFFAHLRAAGLIPGGGLETTRPTNAYGGLIGIQDGALLIAGHTTVFGQLEGAIVKIIEARLDDGKPDSGRIQSDQTGQPMAGGGMSLATDYTDSLRYNVALRL
ncbi:MAG: prepilin-type N-terminal cleavage/methylation domain-containing protein [Gammaproteobacteria bacterium]|nr:prepilin-type N-terminal cleavage/methylation domain-containing protein [Gammaproteobacteria bacterium]